MLLAGGQGSRLGTLTKYRAKPAVPFGGKYRIIDFPLSNCINSGIDTVGVLTQYQPLELNTYIGTGAPWDLDVINGGAFVLPPFLKAASGQWYSGTANAICQNIYFIDRYAPDYLLVISGDHIYKMDYRRLIEFHSARNADVTIAVLRVPWEEAPRFGIINTDEKRRIMEFDEKPAHPQSKLASMGVYVFKWPLIRQFLLEDDENAASSHDFGKDVLPLLLRSGAAMYAYPFSGYWKDVGTAESLWEANMELLSDEPQLMLSDPRWRIYSRSLNQPPHYVGAGAQVSRSLVSEGCRIYGQVKNSVLFPGVCVEQGALVEDSVVMAHTVVRSGSQLRNCIIDEQCCIGSNAELGDASGLCVIGSAVHLADGTRLAGGSSVEARSSLEARRRKAVICCAE